MLSRTAKNARARLSQVTSQLSSSQRAMSTQSTKFKLNTGAEIPAVGFGTWQDKDSQYDATLSALKAGYRHIDTARMFVSTFRC